MPSGEKKMEKISDLASNIMGKKSLLNFESKLDKDIKES